MTTHLLVRFPCILLLAGYASASSILPPGDPELEVRDAAESGGNGQEPISVMGFHFSFITPSGTSPLTIDTPNGTPCLAGMLDFNCNFINESGVTWMNLLVVVTPTPGLTFCQAQVGFAGCNPLD